VVVLRCLERLDLALASVDGDFPPSTNVRARRGRKRNGLGNSRWLTQAMHRNGPSRMTVYVLSTISRVFPFCSAQAFSQLPADRIDPNPAAYELSGERAM